MLWGVVACCVVCAVWRNVVLVVCDKFGFVYVVKCV